jgi:uncharacterized DUF497 family protein/predicted DNA binding CopG/RHH family protein
MSMRKTTFEWDEEKDRENQEKHKVSFIKAQQAFLDPQRVIVEDMAHSSEEDRHYCIGRVGDGVMIVRFTYRGNIFASMVQGIGGKEGRYMKTKIKYTEEPMGDLRIIKDFLPPPDRLVLKEDNVKVTISLKKSSIQFFKQQAKKRRISYQKMIREVVDWYASHYQKSA